MPCFWGKLFVLGDIVYMIACSTEYGDLLISRSTDGGNSFDAPVPLIRGSNGKNGNDGVHKNPQPPVIFNDRIYFSLEWGCWANEQFCHAPMVCSAPLCSDLLNPENWAFTPPKKFERFASELDHLPLNSMTIEGTLVITPKGELYDVLRFSGDRQALCYKVNTNDPHAPLEYACVMPFSANRSKFTIKFDGFSGYYYSVATVIHDEKNHWTRNYLCLLKSKDLRSWENALAIYDKRNCSPQKTGFQYVDFDFYGEDIVFVCRTAINEPNDYHNSNYQTFDTIKNFRSL